MIQAFVGLVGGGKSFCSVRRMLSYMALGGRCASNIRLTGWDDSKSDLALDCPPVAYLRSIGWKYQPYQYVYIPFDDMVSNPSWFKRVPAGFSRDRRTLLVIDEATDLFDSLDGGKLRSDSTYRELFHFLRLSRHAHIDVLFVCQDLASINSRLKGLVANIWKSTDMRNFRLGIFKFGFPFDVFMLQLFDRTGKYLIKRDFVRKDKRLFSCYESETFGGALGVKWDGVAVDSSKGKITKKKKEVFSMLWKILVVVSLALCGVSFLLLFKSSPPVSVGSPVVITNVVYKVVVTTNQVQNVSSPVSPSLLPDRSRAKTAYDVVRGSYNFHQCGNLKWVEFEGDDYRIGAPSEFGRVLVVDEFYTVCSDDEGHYTVLRPGISEYERAANAPPLRRFSSSRTGGSACGAN